MEIGNYVLISPELTRKNIWVSGMVIGIDRQQPQGKGAIISAETSNHDVYFGRECMFRPQFISRMNVLPRIAVLIDGDNIPFEKLPELMNFVSNRGTVVIRKVFGDWMHGQLSGWKSLSAQYGCSLVQATAYTSGKNTSDLSIVIESMDILYQNLADTICIASSDGDFTALAQRLREAGIRVLGFGDSNAPCALVNSCNEYLYYDRENDVCGFSKTEATKSKEEVTPIQRDSKLFLQAFKEAAGNSKEVEVSLLGGVVNRYIKDFRLKDYGCARIVNIYEQLGFRQEKSIDGIIVLRMSDEKS